MNSQNTKSILDEAIIVTKGSRRRDYDSALPNHNRIARLWNAYISSRANPSGEISAIDVSHMMILLKIARACKTPTRDTYIDIAGYAQCSAEIANL